MRSYSGVEAAAGSTPGSGRPSGAMIPPRGCVLRARADVHADALVAACSDRLGRCKLLRCVGFVAVLPRDATGKALRRVLRDEVAR